MIAHGRRLGLALLLLLATGLPAASELPAGNNTRLNDLAWLEGDWEGTVGKYEAELTYSKPKAGLMMGMFRLTDENRTVLLEFFSLRETPEGLVFRVRHFDVDLVPGEKDDAILLKLVSFDGTEAVFENSVHARPKISRLIRNGNDAFVGRSLVISDTDVESTIEVHWQRRSAR